MTLPTNSHSVASPGLATATGEAAGDTAAGLARLRQRLRGALGTQLPTRVQAGQQRTGAVVDRQARQELARAILDEAVRCHSEVELMANRELVTQDAEP